MYPESVRIEIVSDNNSLDFPDSFSIMERGFEFSDMPKISNCSGSLGSFIMASRNGPRTHIGAIAIRMIEFANTVEFMEVCN